MDEFSKAGYNTASINQYAKNQTFPKEASISTLQTSWIYTFI